MGTYRASEVTTPATPPSNTVLLYAKVDKEWYFMGDDGIERKLQPGGGDLLADGTIPLTADWDVGAFKITAQQLESDIATGTAPLIVASTTLVNNLNSDLLDGQEGSYYASVTYVDAAVVGLFDDKGNYDANTNTPDLDVSPSGIKKGDVYQVSVAGTFFTEDVEVGDVIRAMQDDPTLLAHWARTQTNLTAPSVKTLYESNADTNEFSDSEKTLLGTVETSADVTDETNVVAALDGATLTDLGTPVAGDRILIQDASDSNNLKMALFSTFGGGGGGLTPVFKSGVYTAVAGESVRVDSSGGAVTITLPLSPSTNATVEVRDVGGDAGGNNITVARNGETINGAAADYVLKFNWEQVHLVYDGLDWSVSKGDAAGIETVHLRPYDFTQQSGETTRSKSGGSGTPLPIDNLTFAATGYNWATTTIVFPKRWDGGQIRARVFWVPTSTNTGNVEWAFYGETAGDGEALPNIASNGDEVVDAAQGTIDEVHVSPWSAWFSPFGSPTSDEIYFARIQRNGDAGADTFTGTAEMLCVQYQFRTNARNDD